MASVLSAVFTPPVPAAHQTRHAAYTTLFDNFAKDGKVENVGAVSKVRGLYSIDWNATGDHMLLTTKDSSMQWLNVERNMVEKQWQGAWCWAESDPTNPERGCGITWGGDFRIVDARQSEYAADIDLKTRNPKLNKMLNLCWRPDSTYVAVSTKSDYLQMLDVRKMDILLGSSMNGTSEVNQMCWDTTGEIFVYAEGASPGRLAVTRGVDLMDGPLVSLSAHQGGCISLARDPAGRFLASGGADCLLNLWDLRSLSCVWSYGFATHAITTTSLSHDGSLVAWGTGGGSQGESLVSICGTDSKTLYHQHQCGSPANHVKFHPKQPVLAVATTDCPRDGSYLQVVHTRV